MAVASIYSQWSCNFTTQMQILWWGWKFGCQFKLLSAASVSYLSGHWLECWLLYFCSSSMLICLGKQQRWPTSLSPGTHWQPWLSSGLWASMLWSLGKWQKLCLCNSALQKKKSVNKYICIFKRKQPFSWVYQEAKQ